MTILFKGKYTDEGKTFVRLENSQDEWEELASDWTYIIDLAGSINGGKQVASYYRAKDGRIAWEN